MTIEYSDNAGFVLGPEGVLDSDHVVLRDAVGDDHDEADFRFEGLENGFGGEGRRHVDDAGVAVGRLLGVPAVLEDREPEVLLAGLLGRHSADHLSLVLQRLGGLEGSFFPSHPLADDFGVLVDPHVRLGGREEGADNRGAKHKNLN